MSLVKLLYFATMIIVSTLPGPTQQGAKTTERPQAKITKADRDATQRINVRRVETVRYNVR
jgi:hypothetical protein